MTRKVSPMIPATNAVVLDSSALSIEEVLQKVVDVVAASGIQLPQ